MSGKSKESLLMLVSALYQNNVIGDKDRNTLIGLAREAVIGSDRALGKLKDKLFNLEVPEFLSPYVSSVLECND